MPIDKLVSFSEQQAERLVLFYTDAEREILAEINRALLKGNQTAYLKGMQRNVQAILTDLRAGSLTWCETAIPAVYLKGAENADRLVEAVEDAPKIGMGAIHQQAAEVLANATYNRLGDISGTIGRRVDDIYRTLALENIRGSVAGYESWQKVARNYKEQLAEQGVTGFRDVTGRQWNMKTYTEMVSRTSTMEAHLQGTANRLSERGHDLVVVSDHSKECPKCQPWENKVLSISGKTEGYPTLAEAKSAGLFHPSCRHSLNLFLDIDKEIADYEKQEAQQTQPKQDTVTSGFIPSKTVLEAEKWAVDNGVKYVSYKGMNLEFANNINAAISTLPSDARPKLVANSSQIFKAIDIKPNRRADAYYGVHVDSLYFKFNGNTEFNGGHVVGINTRSYKTIDSMTKRKQEIQAVYKERTGNAWFFNETGETVAAHEMGHVYADIKGLPENWDMISRRWYHETKIDNLKNEKEAFAEAWGAYHSGYQDKLPQEVIDALKGLK